MGIPCSGTPTVKDIDGNIYNTVQIGTQCWTKENLKVSKYNDGTTIPLDTSGGASGNGTGQIWSLMTIGARSIFNHSQTNLSTYGYLYNYYAAKGIAATGNTSYKNLCPNGWHIPSKEEWVALITFLGGERVAFGKMKSIGTTYWPSPNTLATNESGFSAIPGGNRNHDGTFVGIRSSADFWSVTEYNTNNAWSNWLLDSNSRVLWYDSFKGIGNSVRCLTD